ncbi:ATP-binding protein [Streptomyces reniochalinae]|uniref:ATP-binding protein n=2 Tax=Streptomyces reniochalinae TaxID=2250578 RepID=A0A367EU66_9ACTN|nr:ATP-binding protein [Streptomyces reniochalinae]
MQMSPTSRPVDSRGEQLAALRRTLFTGREAELRVLRDLLLNDRRGCFVVWLHGTAGVGKTALLQRFGDEARQHGRTCRTVDMRCTEPTPEAFSAALEAQGPPEVTGVLLVDSGELLGPLEQWLRHVFLPGMPTDALLVVAGRTPPAAEWRTDAQWWHALRSLHLPSLDDGEAAVLLRVRRVPEADIPVAVRAAHGLPLALTLIADARARSAGTGERRPHWELRHSPDLVRELLRLLLRETPSLAQADALYVLALARITTEELVRHGLGTSAQEARQLCAWLRGLSFVRSTTEGLVPHELARDALLADLRWRGAEKYERLLGQLHGYLAHRLSQRTGDRWSNGADLAYVGRDNRVLRAAFDWRGAHRLMPRPARQDDLKTVLAGVEEEHGDQAVLLAEQWWAHQPSAFTVFEDARREVVDWLIAPCLEAGTAEMPDDPVALAALEQVSAWAPLRRSERLLLPRWSTGAHGASPAVAFGLTTLWATTPGLAVSWTATVGEPASLPSVLALYGHQPADSVLDVDGRRVTPFVHDWRLVPFGRWSHTLPTRLLTDEPPAARAPAVAPGPPMPWPDFADAVKQAYRSMRDTRRLAENALLDTRLVPPGSGASALRDVLTETVARLCSSPGQQQLGTVLDLTYVSGPRSQQAAASRAALSFSTYRRRLSTALTKAAELLRERELYGQHGE